MLLITHLHNKHPLLQALKRQSLYIAFLFKFNFPIQYITVWMAIVRPLNRKKTASQPLQRTRLVYLALRKRTRVGAFLVSLSRH